MKSDPQAMKKIYIKLSMVLIVLSIISPRPGDAGSPQPNKSLSFIVGTHASSNVTDVYFEFLKIAYAEIGYETTFKKVPIKRAYINVNEGISDGMVISSKDILRFYKNILIIPEPLTTIELVAITCREDIDVKNLKPYRIGILRGYTITEKKTEKHSRQIVNNHDSLFSMLEANRVDVALAMRRETARFMKKNPQYKNVRIVEPSISRIPLYHSLNKKHEALIPKVTPVIKRLIKEKVLEKLYEPYEI